ncbi:hypothetical protein EU97_0490 [Prochlorococcus marinus str. MIT 9311]|nr:hypothetical protein EU97_0490 [Prochlorococcus marinus str. MIT 9311]
MCAVRGTKLYGLRIKKDSQIQKNYELNNVKKIFSSFKKNWLKFG